ncbi:hypothetical protein DOY81_015344 [Sarcophaga bullata]|nr:hypothetical protein DOY81_015344 [Sarcophaga bullata]
MNCFLNEIHIRKKRLLDSLDEDPALNNCGLHQQDATDDPAFVLVSFDENQFKKGNENIKVLDLHANHEMHMNSCGENYISHEQQSNVATTEENKMPDLNETFCVKEHENKPNKGMQLCQEYRHLDEISHEVLDPLVLDEETLLQLYLDGQMPLTNLWKSQINTINDKNKTKNANNFVAFDNEQETNNNMASYLNESFQMNSCNAGNVSCQEQQADNAMQSPNYLESKIIAFTEANDVNIEGMKLLLNMLDNDKESIASFENPSPINDNEEAFSNENFEMLSGNDNDNESALEVRGEIDKIN